MVLAPSQHQAAGHDGYLAAGPVFAKLTSQQEINFYNDLQKRAPPDAELGSHISHWMPTFMGILQQGAVGGNADGNAITMQDPMSNGETAENDIISDTQNAENPISDPRIPENLSSDHLSANDKQYIVLQNLYHGFVRPSILDIKLGAVLVDDTVSEEKRERLAKVSASTTSGLLHFRVCGMKRYVGDARKYPHRQVFPGVDETVEIEKSDEGDYLKYGKFYGRKLTDANVGEGLLEFFDSNFVNTKFLLTRFHQRLQLFFNCLLDSEVRVKSGSLFFIYETDPKAWENLDEETYNSIDPLFGEDYDSDDDEDAPRKLSSLHFIDFAHSKYVDGEGHDENVVVGVENLIDIIGDLTDKV